MHGRHNNIPGNGYRSNATGTGVLADASRISPEGSMRSSRMYNFEYRKYNRANYGRGGHSKQFQPPLSRPRETGIFMEAGRLAAEYLVSKGVLPPTALSGNWQNSGSKNQMSDFQGLKPHDTEYMRTPMEGRMGNGAVNVGPGRRKYSDEYNFMGLRNSTRGRTRAGSSKNDGSEWSRDFGRNGSWSDSSGGSVSVEADIVVSGGHQGEPLLGKDGDSGVRNSFPGERTQESIRVADIKSGTEKCNSVDNAGAKASSSSNEKDLPSDASVETIKESDDANRSSAEAEKDKERSNVHKLEQKYGENMEVTASSREYILVSEDNLDLMKHSKIPNVVTETCSSLSIMGSQVDPESITKDENINESKLSEASEVNVVDMRVDGFTGNASSHQTHKSKGLDYDGLKAPEVVEELNVASTTRPGQCSRSRSFPERSAFEEQSIDERLLGFRRSNSVFMERGEKRALDDDVDGRKRTKRPRELPPLMKSQSDGCLPFSNSMENQHTSQNSRIPCIEHVTSSPDQKSLDIPKGHTKSREYSEEKQLFPGSFKTFDLNLIETSDLNGNHHVDPVLTVLSLAGTGKQAAPIDVELSMSNNCNELNKYGKQGVDGKDIEVIDLENDFAQEDKTDINQERAAAVLTDPDGFPNNVHNATEIPDIQGGYGLVVSELLEDNIPNSSSIPTDLNSLHSDMRLPNGEVPKDCRHLSDFQEKFSSFFSLPHL
ncbi:Uncharacterized protein Adt_36659 [Abeliophyllum distichum]|uniref:Uncharacterized protein n=1 Tax=Abeliophyllum distichum TaxID=126358 RepID=A0ABD1QI70_9LAMI